MQYLIRTLTDSTGHPFTHVTQARENETFTVIEAESKEEAERKVNKFVLEIDGSHWEGTRKDLIRILNKYTGLVDSEEYPLNIRFMPFDQYKTMKHKKGQ